MDASNLLKPALASGTLRCIGSTTYKEFRNYFEKDRALVRRFQKIDVNEPSVEDAVKILRGLKTNYEKHHKVRYTDGGDPRRGGAVGEIHQRPQAARQGDRRDRRGRRVAGCCCPSTSAARPSRCSDVEEIVAKIARIPPKIVSADDKETLRNLERDLKAMVFGQDKAIEALAAGDQAVPRRAARAGEADRQLPVHRPDRRRQDRGGAAARRDLGHRADPLRHVGIHGAAQRLPADRRAAGLCRLRPGRAADRRHRPASARRAAARRDREGASRICSTSCCR